MTKVTLITGGSRGIGAATARLCAAEGHAVAINYRKDAAAAEEVCLEVKSAGVEAVTVQADTGVEADIMRMFDEVDRTLGVVTNLINNAGIHGPRGRLDALSAADIDHVLDVNVRGYFICAREAIKRMSTKHGGSGGAIVNVSSGSARLGNPNDGVLYAAKIEKSEAVIDWVQPASKIDHQIRALAPFPGAWTLINGERVKLLGSECGAGSAAPGTVLDASLTIACGTGALCVTRAQRAGKAAQDVGEFLRGWPVPAGLKLGF